MSLPSIRYRLFSITMLMSFLLLGVKVGDIFRGGQELSNALVNHASAQQDAQKAGVNTAAKPEAQSKQIAPETKSPVDAVEESTKVQTDNKSADNVLSKTEDKKLGGDVVLPGAPAETLKKQEPSKDFSAEEISLFQSLSRRRDEIEEWSKQVELKENMLGATEQRIKDKIVELKDLQMQLDKVLVLYNQHEDAKIRSLVKIYENMKPADAARIFDELDLPIMLEVVDKMSERKAAPILANMNPLKAKELTVELADQRKLQQPMMDAISASQVGSTSDTSPASPADSREAAPAPAPPATPSPSAP
jgi:flagellar motility protein MotE (MotC chaperone)